MTTAQKSKKLEAFENYARSKKGMYFEKIIRAMESGNTRINEISKFIRLEFDFRAGHSQICMDLKKMISYGIAERVQDGVEVNYQLTGKHLRYESIMAKIAKEL